MKFNRCIDFFVLLFFLNGIILSCTKESYVDNNELSPKDSVLLKAKQWFNRGARSATSNSDINLSELVPNWNSYKVRKNAHDQSFVSVSLNKNGKATAYLSQLVVVIDGQGQPHGIIKEFEKNPFIGNSPLKVYTGDGKLYMEGLYIFETKKLRVANTTGKQSIKQISSTKKGSIGDLRRASSGNDPDDPDWQLDIDEIPIYPPTSPPPPPGDPSTNPPGNGGGGGGCSGCGGGGGGGHYQPDPYAPVEPDYGENPTEPEPPEEYFEIRDSLQGYPCANAVLAYMKQSDSKISSYFNSTFGGPQKSVNIAFVPRTFTNSDYDGMILPSTSINDRKVALSTFILNNSSKEYLLVTMYHEFWHGYMELERYRLQGQFNQKYPEIKIYSSNSGTQYQIDQQYMHGRFKGFIDLMKEDLKIFNPSLSNDVIEALVTSGIVLGRSNQMIILNQNERDTRNGNSLGSKCP